MRKVNFTIKKWSFQGEHGDCGDKGQPGLVGKPGCRGDDGEEGLKGEPGKDGKKGAQGALGQQGKYWQRVINSSWNLKNDNNNNISENEKLSNRPILFLTASHKLF